ncbi:unnamed protein product [Sphenostylis stenocarpa]|uniref:CBS domain-containing protein n=1 Tax=Sphenostylis stenocarpa TaxID=92480 RepID=A0AA86S8D1_9FABA|nr:unnamed protein product [Sphenostylis stenocarpa]
MYSVFHLEVPFLSLSGLVATTLRDRRPPLQANLRCFLCSSRVPRFAIGNSLSSRVPRFAGNSLVANSFPPTNGVYTVGDFMTRKEDLHVVKPTTPVDEALETLVEQRVTGFPVIDDEWNLVGVVSDYDLLALDSISGPARDDNNMFPEVDRTWRTFNEVQELLSKTNGKLIGELMTTTPMVVQETSNLEDAARLLLQTKFRRLPVEDAEGKLVGIITRGNVVRAALQIKRASEKRKNGST